MIRWPTPRSLFGFLLAFIAAAPVVPAQPLVQLSGADALVPEPWNVTNTPVVIAGSDVTFLGVLGPLAADLDGVATVVAEGVDVFEGSVADDWDCGPSYEYVATSPFVIRIFDNVVPSGTQAFCPESYPLGELLLEIEITDFVVWVSHGVCAYSAVFGDFQFTGGSWFDAVSTGGVGWTGELDGTALAGADDLVTCTDDGDEFWQLAVLTAQLVRPGSTPVERSTWGGIKSRY